MPKSYSLNGMMNQLEKNRLRLGIKQTKYLPTGTLQSRHTLAASDVHNTEYQYSAKLLCSLLLPHQDSSLARGSIEQL